MDFDQAYRKIRNILRKFSANSIVEQALVSLWTAKASVLAQLESMPWLTLLLVKWALEDKLVQPTVGPKISAEQLESLRQTLWNIRGIGEDPGRKPNAYLMFRSLMYVQVEFQRKETLSFMRWPALYARLPYTHRSRQQFRAAIGMEPDTFITLTYSLYAAVLTRGVPFQSTWLAPWRPAYGKAVDQVMELFTADMAGLRKWLSAKNAGGKNRGRHELYEFPYLKRMPLLRIKEGLVHCWHPLVFARGVEEAVHLRLAEQFEDEYTYSFSKVFENYVTELANDSGLPSLVELEYKKLVGGDAKAVEVIIDADDCNVLVEAKMSLFADDVLIQDSEMTIFNKTKRVRDAIDQGWRVGKIIREQAALGARFQKSQDFLLVVTSRELLLGSGDMLAKLFPAGRFGYPDDEAATRLPLLNVFILSIEDYEHLMGCVRAGEVNLAQLLKQAAQANERGDTARMFFSDFLRPYTKAWTRPKVIDAAMDASEARMLEVFGEKVGARL